MNNTYGQICLRNPAHISISSRTGTVWKNCTAWKWNLYAHGPYLIGVKAREGLEVLFALIKRCPGWVDRLDLGGGALAKWAPSNSIQEQQERAGLAQITAQAFHKYPLGHLYTDLRKCTGLHPSLFSSLLILLRPFRWSVVRVRLRSSF